MGTPLYRHPHCPKGGALVTSPAHWMTEQGPRVKPKAERMQKRHQGECAMLGQIPERGRGADSSLVAQAQRALLSRENWVWFIPESLALEKKTFLLVLSSSNALLLWQNCWSVPQCAFATWYRHHHTARSAYVARFVALLLAGCDYVTKFWLMECVRK